VGADVDALFFTKTLLASTVCLFCPTAVSYYRSIPSAPTQSHLKTRPALEAMLRVLIRYGRSSSCKGELDTDTARLR